MTPNLAAYKLSFQISPIILVDGIAISVPGSMLPIISITEALNFGGLLTGGANIELDDFFANFQPLPGGSLIDNQIGAYPFANQAVAANAIITQPLTISMLMTCPVRQPLGYLTKTATMLALQAALAQHNNLGGTYTVMTPSRFYTNCIMTSMRDASNGESHQVQNAWQLDFVQPLLTLQDALSAQNGLMSKFTNGSQINGQPAWSGLSPAVGSSGSLAAPNIIPAASGAAGAGTAPPQ
jgi:hypothetical protein